MDDFGSIQVRIELEPRSDPIAGTIDDGHGPREFVGWLALIRVLERAMHDERDDNDAA